MLTVRFGQLTVRGLSPLKIRSLVGCSPNPEHKVLAKQLRASRAARKQLEQAYGQQARANAEAQQPTRRGFKIAQAELSQQLRAREAECEDLRARLAQLPKRVPLKDVVAEAEIVKLAPEAKHLTDAIKVVAYRAETALVRVLAPHYARTEDEGRAFIREVLLSDADILPHPEQHRLVVRLHALANPRSNAALAHLCETLNALDVTYPGTDLKLVYEGPHVA